MMFRLHFYVVVQSFSLHKGNARAIFAFLCDVQFLCSITSSFFWLAFSLHRGAPRAILAFILTQRYPLPLREGKAQAGCAKRKQYHNSPKSCNLNGEDAGMCRLRDKQNQTTHTNLLTFYAPPVAKWDSCVRANATLSNIYSHRVLEKILGSTRT